MKLSAPPSILLFWCLILTACFLAGCNNVDCQAPPSEISIQITDGTLTYPADLDTAARIKVSYQENNKKKYVNDLQRMGDVFFSNILIEESHGAKDPEFSFELNDRVLAKMKMETYINDAKCNGWATISNIYQNGKVVSRSENGSYLIK